MKCSRTAPTRRAGAVDIASRRKVSSLRADVMTALVTGATDGIGLHTARRLAASGRDVLVHGRDRERVRSAVEAVRKHARSEKQVIEGLTRDLSSLEDVRALARDVVDGRGDVSMLFNNAGVYSTKETRCANGHEMTFAVNVLAPFALCGLLLPTLAANARRTGTKSSVLNVASISAAPAIDFDNLRCEKMFSPHGSYAQSKACMKAFSYELYDRLARGALSGASVEDLNVFSCDPGTVNTKMLLAGWGRCGIETYEANDEFTIMVDDIERNGAKHNGAYFVNAAPQPRRSEAGDVDQAKLWRLLEQETGVVYA
jgi:NAD(P)-dependent dehydrogenase (short-subunit alcohol dehydrogenase family)